MANIKKVVTIGGGTAHSILLRELRDLPGITIAAVVSMADSGGSTGILRKKWGVMPPGDIRQCLVALSGKEFLNYKFRVHKFGNILLALAEKITGSFSRGLKLLSWLLDVKGQVIPVTLDNAELVITFSDGTQMIGEGNIDVTDFSNKKVEKLFYKNKVTLNPEALKAIEHADYVVISRGDLYTSLIPNFIVEGMSSAIQNTKAKLVIVPNTFNKKGHTDNWTEQDYIESIQQYIGRKADIIVKDNFEKIFT